MPARRRVRLLARHLATGGASSAETKKPPQRGQSFRLTDEHDAHSELIPQARNNELRSGVGIGTERTVNSRSARSLPPPAPPATERGCAAQEFMERVLGVTDEPGQHDVHGGHAVQPRAALTEEREVVICGAGFAGLAAIKSLRGTPQRHPLFSPFV